MSSKLEIYFKDHESMEITRWRYENSLEAIDAIDVDRSNTLYEEKGKLKHLNEISVRNFAFTAMAIVLQFRESEGQFVEKKASKFFGKFIESAVRIGSVPIIVES